MKIILCNAFSLSMIDREQQIGKSWHELRIPIPLNEVYLHEYVKLIREGKSEFESAVGHTDTAALFSTILGFRVEPNRVSVKLTDPETRAIIGQYVGPRLPEGATELPEGARIEWWIV